MENKAELMALACDQTGLSDFGEDSFEEGLERLVHALNTEARLNATGEYALRDRILMHLRQRLMVEDWYRRHPEIAEETIKAPLIGVSLPRTGSSALSYLLSSDPAVRYLRVWESAQPCPPPSTVDGPDPRRGQVASAADKSLANSTRTPSGIDGAMECQDLMALDFKSQIFQAFAQIPSYSQWLLEADHTSTYQYESRVLKLLQWGEPTRPWRLKAPTHMLYLDALDSVFPDARFVMTHRDPAEVMLSIATVYLDIVSKFTDQPDPAYLAQLNLDCWSIAMERAMAFRAKGNEHRFYDLHFRTMHHDPIGEVQRLYDWLGEPVTPAFAQAMQTWWDSNEATERMPKANPSPFRIQAQEVETRFAPYRQKMAQWAPYPRPH